MVISTDMDYGSSNELISIASGLCAKGKGILASDESPGTLGKRLERHGVLNTEENRRAYRDLFYSASHLEDGIAGVIMFPEALTQFSSNGKCFVECLEERGVIPGVKVDLGLRLVCLKDESPRMLILTAIHLLYSLIGID